MLDLNVNPNYIETFSYAVFCVYVCMCICACEYLSTPPYEKIVAEGYFNRFTLSQICSHAKVKESSLEGEIVKCMRC